MITDAKNRIIDDPYLFVVKECAVRVHVGVVTLLHDDRVGRDLRMRNDWLSEDDSLSVILIKTINGWRPIDERALLGLAKVLE